jgi:hypothetical protein
MRVTFESLMKPATVVAMHDGDAACAELRKHTRRASLLGLVVLAGATQIGARIAPEPLTVVAGAALTLALVTGAVAFGRTRTLSFALLLGLSTTIGVLLGVLDRVSSSGATDGASDGPLLVGAGITCVTALVLAELLGIVAKRPTVTLLGPIVIGALAPWSSSFALVALPHIAPLGAFTGAVIALVFVLSARLADVAMPYLVARDEGVSGALLRYVELPRLFWSSTFGENVPEGHA